MKKQLLTALLSLILGSASAQQMTCPSNFQDSTFGAWPDTTINFAHAYVDVPYVQELNFKAPSDAGDIDPTYSGAQLQKYKVTGVTGLPAGFSYTCSKTNCEYPGGQAGCANLTGTATASQIGIYDITIKISATVIVAFVPLPIPRDFIGYKLIIEEAPVDLGTKIIAPDEAYVYPNPAKEEINIVNAHLFDSYAIYGINGQLINNAAINSDNQKVSISELKEGIYFIHLIKDQTKSIHKFVKK